jgi:hypothetical protein
MAEGGGISLPGKMQRQKKRRQDPGYSPEQLRLYLQERARILKSRFMFSKEDHVTAEPRLPIK